MTRTRYRKTNAAFTAAREYDVLDRVTNVVYAARDGTPLYALSYAYDPDGLVTRRVVVSASGAVTNSYAYDGLARLVSESDSLGNSASCAYDLCGNRLSVTTPSGTVSSAYTHNRRDADMYDAGGRVTRTVNGRGQLLDLAWNLQGELVSVSTNGVFAEGYAYDPMGRRIATTDSSGTVYHAYDGIHCVADLAPDGTLLRSHTWGSGIDNLLAVTLYGGDSTNTLYAVTDPLGTVHALVGTNGTSQLWFTYDSWGNITVASQPLSFSASQLRFTWQGREYSHATALYSFRARWYDPASGRWLSKDPIGLEGGLNLYEAFGNNPVCFRDPEGLRWGINRNGPAITPVTNIGTNDLTASVLHDALTDAYVRLQEGGETLSQSTFDTKFWDGHSEDKYWNDDGRVYRGDDINYIGIGMYDAFHGKPLWWSKTKTVGWKLWNYLEWPNRDVMQWLEFGYRWSEAHKDNSPMHKEP
ncbi:MAG: hypothetical protein IJR99_12175 [Kiritimatiellae bacterium]|nr:hypothetical protein [Kiritimatiellia bacterium]